MDYFGQILIQNRGVIYGKLILPLDFESKFGSKEPQNRQKLKSKTVSKWKTAKSIACEQILKAFAYNYFSCLLFRCFLKTKKRRRNVFNGKKTRRHMITNKMNIQINVFGTPPWRQGFSAINLADLLSVRIEIGKGKMTPKSFKR